MESSTALPNTSIGTESVPSFCWFRMSMVSTRTSGFLELEGLLQPPHTALGKLSHCLQGFCNIQSRFCVLHPLFIQLHFTLCVHLDRLSYLSISALIVTVDVELDSDFHKDKTSQIYLTLLFLWYRVVNIRVFQRVFSTQ